MAHCHGVTPENCDIYPLPRLGGRLSSGGDAPPAWVGEDTERRLAAPAHLGFKTDGATNRLAQNFITGAAVGDLSQPFRVGRQGTLERSELRRRVARGCRERLQACYDAGWSDYDAGIPMSKTPYADSYGLAYQAGWLDNRDGWYGRTEL